MVVTRRLWPPINAKLNYTAIMTHLQKMSQKEDFDMNENLWPKLVDHNRKYHYRH